MYVAPFTAFSSFIPTGDDYPGLTKPSPPSTTRAYGALRCRSMYMQLADDEVCVGTFNSTGLILSHSLRGFSPNGTTAVKFCNAVFGLCQVCTITPFLQILLVQSVPSITINATDIFLYGRPPLVGHSNHPLHPSM